MTGKAPQEIWDDGAEEGARRMDRDLPALVATGFVGGIDVMLGILALVSLGAGLHAVMPEATSHALASWAFGIGFVLIVLGRSELFTENFLVPVSTVVHGDRSVAQLVRLWVVTLVGNLLGLILLSLILTRAGVMPPDSLKSASTLAETYAHRDAVAALLSAVVAGTVMTLLTWVMHAAESSGAKVLVALLLGYLLAVPSLNHAVVSFGEMAFGILAGRGDAQWVDLAQNLPLAIVGNLVGGLLLVTAARLVQVRGEPDG